MERERPTTARPDMIENGTQLLLRPTHGDPAADGIGPVEAVGRVVDATAATLVVRVGRHPWIKIGTRLTCAARSQQTLSEFRVFVDEIDHSNGFTIRIRRPLAVQDVNRRTEPRLQVGRNLVWSRVVDGRLVGNHEQGVTLDVSTGGLSYETAAHPPEMGALIAIAIALPIGNLVTLGHVTGVNDTTAAQRAELHHVRISSDAIDPAQLERYRRWISDELQADLIAH